MLDDLRRIDNHSKAHLWSLLGIAYARDRGLSRSAGIAMSAAEERGAEPLALVRRGYLLLDRDVPVDEALALFDQAVALDPEAFFTRFERGRVRCQERRYEGGLEDLAIALARRPDHLQARYLRTKALGALGRFEEGRPEVEELLGTPLVESDPHLLAGAAYFASNLGDRPARWYESQGSLDEAIHTLEFLERMAPDYGPGREDLERLRGAGS